MTELDDAWERNAKWWSETFTNGADIEYELQILPLVAEHLKGARRVLDLGSGEGQVARHLIEQANGDCVVVGLEPSVAQLANAKSRAGGPRYVRGVGERLPFHDACFDGVVCSLVIEHCADVDAVLAEAARVLCVGGRFVLIVNHPLFQGTGSGLIDDEILGEHYWRVGPYLNEGSALEQVDADVQLRFAHRPLSRYVNPVTAAGCVLTYMEEPEPPPAFLQGSLDLELEQAIPRLLLLRFERVRPL